MRSLRRRFFRVFLSLVALSIALPTVLVLPWRWLPVPTSSFIVTAQRAGTAVSHQWVDWRDISVHLPIAVVAAEDQGFPDHHGFDLESIRSALAKRGEHPRGASTISQQVAKNLFLWPARSWLRKGVEGYLTLYIEALWPKRRILEIYLNIAEFGPGIYGAEAAASSFFGVPAAALSSRQAALLAAVLPSPKRFSAVDPSSYVQHRADWIQQQVKQLGGPAYLADL